jgi:membrane protein YdbS with pleckstrin-like domain
MRQEAGDRPAGPSRPQLAEREQGLLEDLFIGTAQQRDKHIDGVGIAQRAERGDKPLPGAVQPGSRSRDTSSANTPSEATMKTLLRPSVVIPVTLSGALLAALVAVSNPAQVVAVMEGFQHVYLLYVLLLIGAYEAVRCAPWRFLLTCLGIRVPLRTQVSAFLCGEVTKSLPAGNYFQNYLLRQAKGTDFGRSSTATTLIMVTEVAICLAGLVIIGLGDWSSWLRPVIVIGLAAFLFMAWAVHTSGYSCAAPTRLWEHAGFRMIADEVRRFCAGAWR